MRENVPAELQELPIWLLWQFAPDPKGRKPKKVPYYTNGEPRGKTDEPADRTQLVAFEQAAAVFAHSSHDGIGAALGDIPGSDKRLNGIDLDGCVAKDGTLDERATRCIHAADSYAEFSPSGSGIHIIGYGKIGTTKKDARGLEIYDHGRYFTFTGQRLNGSVVKDTAPAAALARELFLKTAPEARAIPEGSRNNELYAFACGLRAKSAPENEAWEALQRRNGDCDPPLDDAELRSIFQNAWKYPAGNADVLEKINEQYALIWHNSQLLVLWKHARDNGFPRLSSIADLRKYHLKHKVGRVNPFDAWMEHPGRAEYTRIVFEPGEQRTPGAYNLFQGWAREPRQVR